MIDHCDVCGKHNGSCNEYQRADGEAITICPSCLMWGMDSVSKMARDLHKAGKKAKEAKSNESAGAKKARALGRR